jgi:hypothetical protein
MPIPKIVRKTVEPRRLAICIIFVKKGEEYIFTNERTVSSKARVSPSDICSVSQPKKINPPTAIARAESSNEPRASFVLLNNVFREFNNDLFSSNVRNKGNDYKLDARFGFNSSATISIL